MQLHLTGRNLDITTALKTFTEEKFQKLERHTNNITNINIVLHLEHLTHMAEATLLLSGTEINAHAKSEDMYNAIDELVNKLITQITKHKEKMSNHH